ncbi:MAG: HPr(Ser) kinase/phosphatase [Deltaproteobacteria bacterium]|nr:HPr(Ser) kinase/phosphatase [Deltaproteobacteria bacterium]
MAYIRVGELLEHEQENLEMTLIAGSGGLDNKIYVPHIQNPGLAMAGYTKHVVNHRMQVFGKTEISYLHDQKPAVARKILTAYFEKGVCCCVVTRFQKVPDVFVELAEASKTPVLRTRLTTQEFINRATRFLETRFARRTTMHGVLVDVFGVGVLMLGKSAIGKSECALDLILKGHRLVADDIVELARVGPDSINGRGPQITKYLMEIRGLGIINIKEMFGIGAIRDKKKVHLVVRLVEWNENTEYDRVGLDDQFYQILGVELPMVTIPVRPGRNLTAIVEVAARNHLLKLEGYHAAKEFQDGLLAKIAGQEERVSDDDVLEEAE